MEITARYQVESFTFYSDIESILHHHETSKEKEEEDVDGNGGDGDGGLITTTTTTVTVQIQYASSSRGGSIVSAQHDTTGLFLWPATYLLCQYLLLEYHPLLQLLLLRMHRHPDWLDHHHHDATMNILELGCGCGMVSSVFMKYHLQQQQLSLQQQSYDNGPNPPSPTSSPSRPPVPVVHWYATDMDTKALDLTYHNNHVLNQIPCRNHASYHHHHHRSTDESLTVVQPLSWGNVHDIQAIREILQPQLSPPHQDATRPMWWDVIVAADIIYPTQDGTVLQLLFDTFRALLRPTPGGTVILSYCHRDPTDQTLWNFIQAATAAHFIIAAPPDRHDIYHPILRRYLPPLLDAQILLLHRASDLTTARVHNEALGRDDCRIFPGRQTRRQQRQEQQQNGDDDDEDDWDAPPVDFHTE